VEVPGDGDESWYLWWCVRSPHISHVLSVAYSLAGLRVDKVIVIPCWGHAFGKQMTPFHHRLTMTERAFETFDPERVRVSDLERTIRAGYTVDLLGELHLRMPDDQLVLIMGEDEWAVRDKWHRWSDVEKLAEVAVVGREGVPDEGRSIRMPDISSTQIRNLIRDKGPEAARCLVPTVVLDYIREHGLFH